MTLEGACRTFRPVIPDGFHEKCVAERQEPNEQRWTLQQRKAHQQFRCSLTSRHY
jgi:hypothetical protein